MSSLQGRAGGTSGFDSFRLADGTVLAVLDEGPSDASTTIVLHHGWTQDHTSWEDVASRLSERFRVISYDARGHGRSDAGPRGTATLSQLADDLAEIVAAKAPSGPLVLAGHSLGGPVVLTAIDEHPELARRVIGVALVATSAANIGRDILGLPQLLTRPAMVVAPAVFKVRGLSRAARNSRFPRLLEQVIRIGLYGQGGATRANRSRTARQVARSHPATTAALAIALAGRDWTRMLPALSDVPTVILAGFKDALTPIAHSEAMALALPSAKLVIYPDAGHMLPYEVPYEVPDEVAAEIAALAEGR